MKKSQLALIIIGIAAVTFLFTLPKVVVKDEEGQLEVAEEPADDDKVSAIHNFEISEAETQKLNEFRVDASFDSLINFFSYRGFYDSAAVYSEKKANKYSSEENWKSAGNAWYDAMTFAAEPSKITSYGQKAREAFENMKFGEEDLSIQNKIAMTYITTEDPMKGIVILREILAKDPDNEEALFNLGILSMQSGQYDKAIDRFKAILTINENNTKALFYLGLSYLEKGNKAEARKALEEVKEKDSDPEVQASADSYLREL